MIYSRIAGTGSYLPEKVLTNNDLEKMIDTSDEWIVTRTGIHSRHMAAPHETASTMATQAAEKAIAAANIDRSEIDMIIVATCTSDCAFPSTACLVQGALGLNTIPAFDISAACAGFCYALSMADQYIRNGAMKTILIVGSEVMSRTVDWTDRKTCILFGDGAGAILLTASNEPGIHSTHLHADGHCEDLLYMTNEMNAPGIRAHSPYVYMRGPEVFKCAVNALSDILDETMAANNIDKTAIDWLIPHQANIRIIQATAKKLNLPMEKVILTLQEQGNTSGASVPLALDYGIRSGRIQRGDKLLLEAFGSGLVWGSALITY